MVCACLVRLALSTCMHRPADAVNSAVYAHKIQPIITHAIGTTLHSFFYYVKRFMFHVLHTFDEQTQTIVTNLSDCTIISKLNGIICMQPELMLQMCRNAMYTLKWAPCVLLTHDVKRCAFPAPPLQRTAAQAQL